MACKAKTDVWMPLYIADYLADTSRLTTVQHGAYLLLIMDYWRNGSLPDDDAILAQITRMQPDAWSIARASISKFFSIENGQWLHGRIEAEIEKAGVNSQKAHDRAVKAATARWEKEKAPSIATSNIPSNAQEVLESCPSPSPSPSPIEIPLPSQTPKVKSVPGAEKPAPPQKISGADPEKPETELQAACRATWSSYCAAYFDRYQTEPVRNAKVNSNVKQVVQRLGGGEAPLVAAHFVGSNLAYYVQRGHVLDCLVADAEKLRTEWATGRIMTGTQANNDQIRERARQRLFGGQENETV